MRIATFNLESLDLPPKADHTIDARAAVLRPALQRLDADILCLQEINAQRVEGQKERALLALDALLSSTPYADFHRACSTRPDGTGPADVHNLVTLSRLPITAARDVRHNIVPPASHTLQTAAEGTSPHRPLHFERPLLLTEHALPGGRTLTVINLHLRAPLAAAIPGGKLAPFVWRSVSAWAEGYFLSATLRAAQALELRLLIDRIQADDPTALLAVAGDFNAGDHETALTIATAAEEDTGNGNLAAHNLVILDRALPADRRWSTLHHGRPQMPDHILASRPLYGAFRGIEVHNEALGDEAIGYAKVSRPLGSYHAPLVAEFALSATI